MLNFMMDGNIAPFDVIGFLPEMLSPHDARSAKEQLDSGYAHGGGWNAFPGFVLGDDNSLKYPGDRAMPPIAQATLREELIILYDCGWVAVIQPDRTFEVSRMD